jgi:uncharacterized protein YlxP (DUF503 family)
MTAGILKIILFIPDSSSLKEKRMVLHSLKSRLRNSFNIAVSQVADEDKWQRATLAVAAVEKNRQQVNSVLSAVVNFLEKFNSINIIDYEMELI